MTLVRAPLSTEGAFDLVIGVLTIDVAAQRTGRDVAYLRAISTPTNAQRLLLDDAVALDAAYAEFTPGHYPLFESYRLRLQLAGSAAMRDAVELGRLAAKCVREGGEGCAALVEAALPGASDRDLERAIGELEQGRNADAEAIGGLREVLRRRRGAPEAPDTS